MTNPMLAELDEVVRLMEKATPGPWESASRGRYYVGQQEDEASVHGADDADIDEVSNVSPLHLADTIRGDCYKPDADLIAAAVNFLRTHHATLADMAKRLEAAERDAKDAVCVTKAQKIVRDIWETWYPGNEWTPASTTLGLLHQIGNSLLGVPEFERVADSRLRAQNAIDAAQEGEG